MIHKNLTPFFWGPRITSRRPPQPEMAICVRGVFRLVPGKPLEIVADPIEQGFMSGDTFLPDDIAQEGALVETNDFADWKLHTDLLLRGTCHPPGGNATACDVRFGVGGWSKTLHVVGPRVYQPGLLLGGKMSEPQPFQRMPLTWQNAYGGEGYADNPVGRGYAGEEMPTVELPSSPVTKKGKGGVVPASFLSISPHWPQRAGKRGKRYDAKWKKTRAPFYSEDFDWTYFQAAPEDQRLDGYLRGDERVTFENLHPAAATWSTNLPGLRVRAFVKTQDGRIVEPEMHLDTLFADTDAGKLFLTWRGHAEVEQIDMTDVAVVLVASEPLDEPPQPFEHYAGLLTEFEDDPVGLKSAFPPGFLEVAAAVEAAELAERNGEPMPDLKAVADNLPPGCPFPPWFLAAVAGDEDPLGIQKRFPPGMLDGGVPLDVAAKVGDLSDPDKLKEALAEVPDPKDDPTAPAKVLRALVGLMPPEKQAAMEGALDALDSGMASTTPDGSSALAKANELAPPPTSTTSSAGLASALDQAKAAIQQAPPAQAAELASAAAALPASPDELWAKALAPLDAIQLPELPAIPDVEAQLTAEREALAANEAKMREKFGDHPMLGLFALGRRLIDNAPRPADIAPDFTPFVGALGKVQESLVAQGVGLAALAPLTRLIGRVDGLVAALPKRTPPPEGEFAGKDLRRRDLRRRDLRGVDLRKSDLTGALLADADLSGADLRRADLTSADLTGAILEGADLSGATLSKAVLQACKARSAVLVDAELGAADLGGADLEGARFEQARCQKARFANARLVGADLRFADLSKADLTGADLSGANLSLATADLARADGANLTGITFDMGRLTKCRLRGAVLTGARSSMGSLAGSDLTGADLRGVRFEKVDFMKSVLDDADCRGASLVQAILRDTQAIGCDLRDAELRLASATGAAVFRKARFTGADGTRSTWMDVDLEGADLSRATFPNAYFQGARGEGVDFSAARLKGACFRRATLVRPSFRGADLAGADFNCASLDDADFRDANCYDSKFLGTRAVRSDFTGAFVAMLQLDDPEAQRS